MFHVRSKVVVLSCVLCSVLPPLLAADALRPFILHSNDVVGFVGGSDVAAAQFTGHLETLMAVAFSGARFRNFGWEGDTVFAHRREIGFPPLAEHLKRAGVTMLFVEFGRAEALAPMTTLPEFIARYEKFLDQCAKQTPRIVLVIPPPFERADEPLRDLSKRNQDLAAYANALRSLAAQRSVPIVDLFSNLGSVTLAARRLTDDGLQLTQRGHALAATAWARELGFAEVAARAGKVSDSGAWSHGQYERLRQVVIEKNQLWLNYWRPQNWAFLGGDRISQPSSHDHRQPENRWFPAEMEKYLPLIREKEAEIEKLAFQLRGGAR